MKIRASSGFLMVFGESLAAAVNCGFDDCRCRRDPQSLKGSHQSRFIGYNSALWPDNRSVSV